MRFRAAALIVGLGWGNASAETRLGDPFTDHAVLQRDRPLRIWGEDEPGAGVTVTLGDRQGMALADADGRWFLRLEMLPAGGPYRLTAQGTTTVQREDILIGDLWLCAGQSNIEWPLGLSEGGLNAAREVDESIPIRLLRVPRQESAEPRTHFAQAPKWRRVTPELAAEFSGVAWFFGRSLHAELDVPIGLILTSWGGTRIEPWIGPPGFTQAPVLREIHARQMNTIRRAPELMRAWHHREDEWRRTAVHDDPGRDPKTKGWEAVDFNDSDWQWIDIPMPWARAGHAMNGAAWYRMEVEVPESWIGAEARLRLGPVDDSDDTWFNGERVGGITHEERELSFAMRRVYPIRPDLLRAGRNLIAIRVWDRTGDGGLTGSSGELVLENGMTGESIPLPTMARFQVERLVPLPALSYLELMQRYRPPLADVTAHPSRLYNGMISPLVPLDLKGVIWYQGESNVGEARNYRRLLPALIADWRTAFDNRNLGFYFVQLASYGPNVESGAVSEWAELREAQRSALSVPGTGMVVTIDVGDPQDIHPRNKRAVGERLAEQALAKSYGLEPDTAAIEGPLAVGARRDGARVRVWFASVGTGLELRGDAPDAFELAGENGVFHPATATIEGETLVVSSPRVPEPWQVRYGWNNSPPAVLFNQQGYPASPFTLALRTR